MLFVFASTYLQRGFSRWHMLFNAFSLAGKYPAWERNSIMVISFLSGKIFAEVKVMEAGAVQVADFVRNQGGGRVRS